MSDRVVVGLGGSLGGADAIAKRIAAAIRSMVAAGAYDARVSRLYRSAPVGAEAGAVDYVNAVASMRLPRSIAPVAWLLELWRIERALGRVRPARPRGGPRHIDLDILLWRSRWIDTRLLSVPHPRLASRAFVLRPLADLTAPETVLGTLGRLDALLAATADQRCEPLVAHP